MHLMLSFKVLILYIVLYILMIFLSGFIHVGIGKCPMKLPLKENLAYIIMFANKISHSQADYDKIMVRSWLIRFGSWWYLKSRSVPHIIKIKGHNCISKRKKMDGASISRNIWDHHVWISFVSIFIVLAKICSIFFLKKKICSIILTFFW